MNQISKNEKGFGAVETLLLIIIVILVGVSGYIVAKNAGDKKNTASTKTASVAAKTTTKPKSTSTTAEPFQLPSGWTWYTNTQIGFQLAYPSTWGQPTSSNSPGVTGTLYELDFSPDTGTPPTNQYGTPEYKSRDPIMVQLATDNYSFTSTNDAGKTGTGGPEATSASVEKVLSTISSYKSNCSPGTCQPIVAHNATSYSAILTNTPSSSTTDLLDLYGIVNLPKMNVSGIFIDYEQLDSESDCTLNALSSNSKQFCINQNVQDTLSQVASSVKATS
jgi:hypothetical protein